MIVSITQLLIWPYNVLGTTFGVSELTYGGDILKKHENCPQGILKGNTACPNIWSALSSVVFEVLHKRGFGCKIITLLSKQLFKFGGVCICG